MNEHDKRAKLINEWLKREMNRRHRMYFSKDINSIV